MKKDKTCPQCGHLNFRIASRCKECSHVFFALGGKKKRKAKAIEPPADTAGFSAGLTLEGGLMVFWYGRSEFQKFTAEETALIRQALAPKSLRDFSAEVPSYLPHALTIKTE